MLITDAHAFIECLKHVTLLSRRLCAAILSPCQAGLLTPLGGSPLGLHRCTLHHSTAFEAVVSVSATDLSAGWKFVNPDTLIVHGNRRLWLSCVVEHTLKELIADHTGFVISVDVSTAQEERRASEQTR